MYGDRQDSVFTGLHAGIGREAAVDGNRHAGDEACGIVVEQEQHRAAELLFAVAEAAHGRSGQDLARAGRGRAVRVEEQRRVLLGGEEAGGDGVDANADLAEMHRQPLGKVGDGGFRAGIGGDLGQRRVGVHAADVQDVAALPAHHLPGKGLGGQQRANEVQVEHEFHAGFVQIEEGFCVGLDVAQLKVFLVGGSTGIVAARAVEQDVAGAKVGQHLIGHSEADVLVQYVAAVRFRHAALGHDFLGEFVGVFIVQIQQGHLRAGPGQDFRKIGAQHAARAGDHGDLAGQIGIQYILLHLIFLPCFLYRWPPTSR